MVFPDAPLELHKRAGDSIAMRTWWKNDDTSNNSARYEGWDTTLNSLKRIWKTQGPFVGVIGFSQGAAVGFLLALLAETADRDAIENGARRADGNTPNQNENLSDSSLFCSLDFVVLCAGYVPTPLPIRVPGVRPSLGYRIGEDTSPRACLVFAGVNDEAVPFIDATQSSRWFVNCEILEHDGKHEFPRKANLVDSFVRFIANRVEILSGKEFFDAAQPSEPFSEVVSEELEALHSIFDGEMTTEGVRAFAFSLSNVSEVIGPDLCVNPAFVLELPIGYPERRSPIVRRKRGLIGVPPRVAAALRDGLDRCVSDATANLLGEPCVFSAVTEAREWLENAIATYLEENKIVTEDVIISDDAEAIGVIDDTNGDDNENVFEVETRWWEDEDEDEEDDEFVTSASEAAVPFTQEEQTTNTGYTESTCTSESTTSYQSQAGRWNYVIGLVGKPSAGKSTFFNSVCELFQDDLKSAKVASHPFTTIKPNIAKAFAAVPCVCHEFSNDWKNTCYPIHGATTIDGPNTSLNTHTRSVPVTVKDVAGLVPGAHKGRGRGNAFLNDLCDADVLVHVVDASGRSDRDGVDHTGGVGGDGEVGDGSGATCDATGDDNTSVSPDDPSRDPSGDVAWVRHELHRWIFGNVKRNWHTVRRKPEHLRELFTGYHCSPSVADQALLRCGVSDSTRLESNVFLTWQKKDLHLLVAHFLRIRFPVLLALNKSDLPESKGHVDRIRRQWPGETCVSISAKLDLNSVRVAVASAVALKPPTLGFPVDDLDLGTSKSITDGTKNCVAETSTIEDTSVGSLRHCVLLKPGSSVGDFFTEAIRSKLCVSGELVRCETVDEGGKKRVVRKNELVTDTKGVVKFFVNRIVKWQGGKGSK